MMFLMLIILPIQCSLAYMFVFLCWISCEIIVGDDILEWCRTVTMEAICLMTVFMGVRFVYVYSILFLGVSASTVSNLDWHRRYAIDSSFCWVLLGWQHHIPGFIICSRYRYCTYGYFYITVLFVVLASVFSLLATPVWHPPPTFCMWQSVYFMRGRCGVSRWPASASTRALTPGQAYYV